MMSFSIRRSIETPRSFLLPVMLLLPLSSLWPGRMAWSQVVPPAPAPELQLADETMVDIALPNRVSLDGLLKYMSQRLQIRYQTSNEIGSRQVIIQTPAKVPLKSLPLLLSSVLKSEGLVIVDSDVSGWKSIVTSKEMSPYAATAGPDVSAESILRTQGAGAPVTQVFLLTRHRGETLIPLILQFQGKGSPAPVALPSSNVLIVTDYAANVKKIAELIALIDSPVGESVFKFYAVKNQMSATLTEQVQGVFGQKEAAKEAAADSPQAPKSIRLFDDPKGNRILVIGRKELVEEALKLLQDFDVELGLEPRSYHPKFLTAERLDNIIKGYLPEQDLERAYQGTIDEEGNLLVVRATSKIHDQIQRMLEDLDKTGAASSMPMEIIKLRNARANEVLFTLLALQDAYGSGFNTGAGQFFGGAFGVGIPGFPLGIQGPNALGGLGGFGTGMGGLGTGGLGGMGQFGGQPFQSQSLPLLPGQPTTTNATSGLGSDANAGGGTGRSNQRNQVTPNGGGLAAGGSASLPGGARVSADVATNSLIIVAPASIQPIYKKLIESLDQRRPQVLIEAKLIAVDTTDNFTLAVETSFGDREGLKRVFNFTSYGLSEVNPLTGALRITPGRGYNATIVDPQVADVVVRALATHSRSRVLAEPSILVNDNDTGTLESVVAIPFSSVNASNTVSTTSLGGTQEAGTTISVTPQINEDDNLQLEFQIEFSSFTGTGTATLPPATNRQTVESVITIPDGQTVIVGGLKRVGGRQEYSGIPWIEKIPILRDLTGRTDESKETTSFFVFIRPLIMRDSRFQDLQYVSDRQAGFMGIPSGYPSSQPIMMK